VVEVPCTISKESVKPKPCGQLPESVRGLVLAVKVMNAPQSVRSLKIMADGAAAMLEYPSSVTGNCPKPSKRPDRVLRAPCFA
jgi:hypothetical protein